MFTYEMDFLKKIHMAARRHGLLLAVVSAFAVAIMAESVWVHEVRRQAGRQRKMASRNERVAEQARNEAESVKRELEWEKYINTIGLAQTRVNDLRFDLAKELLNKCPRGLRDWEWGRLKYLCHLDRLTIPEACSPLAFAPDGKKLASGSSDNAIRIWDSESGRELLALRGHSDWISSLAYSRDGKRIASASWDNTIRVWDTEKGKERIALRGHSSSVNAVAFSFDSRHIVAGAEDGSVGIWDAESGRQLLAMKSRLGKWMSEGVNSISFTPDGRQIVAGTNSGLVTWDAKTGKQLKGSAMEYPSCVAFSPDGKRLAAGGGFLNEPGTLVVWDAWTGWELHRLVGHTGPVDSITFSPDGKRIASLGRDAAINLWDAESGHKEVTIADAQEPMAFSLDGERVGFVSQDGKIRICNSRNGQEEATLRLPGRPFLGICMVEDPGGVKVTETIEGCPARQTGVAPEDIITHLNGSRIRTCRDVHQVIDSQKPGAAIKITLRRKGVEKEFRTCLASKPGLPVDNIAFSADGRRIVSCGWGCGGGNVMIWDVNTGRESLTLDKSDGAEYAAFLPDDRHVMAGDITGGVRVWDAGMGAVLTESAGQNTLGRGPFAFTSDMTRFAAGADNAALTMKIWDVATGRELAAFTGNGGSINAAAFSADGKRIAACDTDGVWIWDVEAREKSLWWNSDQILMIDMAAINGRMSWHNCSGIWVSDDSGRIASLSDDASREPSCVAISRDGRRVVSGGRGAKVHVWDAESGKLLTTLKGHSGFIDAVAFSPDGRWIASAGDGVKIWDWAAYKESFSIESDSNGTVFTPDRRYFAFVERRPCDGGIKVLDAKTGVGSVIAVRDPRSTRPVALSVDGKRLVCADDEMVLRVYDVPRGKEVFKIDVSEPGGKYVRAALSPDGRRIASTCCAHQKPGRLKLWDVESGQCLKAFEGHSKEIRYVAFAPNGRWIVSADDQGNAKVWDTEGMVEALTLTTGFCRNSAVFSPDSRRIVSSGINQDQARIWDLALKRQVAELGPESVDAQQFSFSCDGSRILSGQLDGTVILWDAESGRPLLVLKGHPEAVEGVAFNQNGTRIVSADRRGNVKIWSTRTGRELMTLSGFPLEMPPFSIAFGVDDGLIALQGENKVHVWPTLDWRTGSSF